MKLSDRELTRLCAPSNETHTFQLQV